MAATKDSYPTDVTDEEAAFGFTLREIPNDTHYFGDPDTMNAVVADLDNGLVAVKMRPPAGLGGPICYAVWGKDASGQPRAGARGEPASSLVALAARHRPTHPPQEMLMYFGMPHCPCGVGGAATNFHIATRQSDNQPALICRNCLTAFGPTTKLA